MGYSVQETDLHLRNLLDSFTILQERPEVADAWRQLVLAHEVRGVQVHDARLVAAMKVNRIQHILTYNAADFKRYQWLTILTPMEVLQP